jgi:flagellin-like protein
MKANRKFRNDDEAVSPVIAVILMVAITVVLAATVYVWVSGFGAQSGQPQKSIALTSAGALSGGLKTYTIASSTTGMKFSDITVTVNGATQSLTGSAGACSTAAVVAGLYQSCAQNAMALNATVIHAGDTLTIAAASGNTLRILDAQANAVILTLTVG